MIIRQVREASAPELPEILKQARRKKGMSLLALQRATGVSRGSLLKFESGKATAIALPTLEKISKALDIDINWSEKL
jgi:transcriptional regulator with XRE-family HTH domain